MGLKHSQTQEMLIPYQRQYLVHLTMKHESVKRFFSSKNIYKKNV